MLKFICVIALALVSASCWYNSCGGSYTPVCGNNGVTYNNACMCRRAGIRVSYRKACTTVATASYDFGNNWSYPAWNYGNWGHDWNHGHSGHNHGHSGHNHGNWGYGFNDWDYSPVTYSAPAVTTYVGDAM